VEETFTLEDSGKLLIPDGWVEALWEEVKARQQARERAEQTRLCWLVIEQPAIA